jgi:hypothetical protein
MSDPLHVFAGRYQTMCLLMAKSSGIVFKGRDGLGLSVSVNGAESPFIPVVGGHQVLLESWATGGLSMTTANAMCYGLSSNLDGDVQGWDERYYLGRFRSVAKIVSSICIGMAVHLCLPG